MCIQRLVLSYSCAAQFAAQTMNEWAKVGDNDDWIETSTPLLVWFNMLCLWNICLGLITSSDEHFQEKYHSISNKTRKCTTQSQWVLCYKQANQEGFIDRNIHIANRSKLMQCPSERSLHVAATRIQNVFHKSSVTLIWYSGNYGYKFAEITLLNLYAWHNF